MPRYVEVGAVALITLMAVFLRTWDLSGTPAGVHGDETEIAMEALRSIRGESLGIWTGVTLGVPAGYAHWMSLIFRIGGADITTMRLASAIPGAAIVPVGYLLVRSLFPFRVAVLSVVMLTVSLWFIVQSRIAFGGITSVFMALLAMWLIVAAAQSRRPWVAVAAGVALGLGLYSFKSFLFYFVGIWGVALLSLAASRELRRIWEIWLCLGVSALVGAPMILFYATSGFIGSNLRDLYAVSLSDPSTWERIPGMALQTVLLIHNAVQGNTTDGSPAIPIVPFVASMFFWAGVLALLLFIKERRYQLLLAAWLIGMAPVLIVTGAEGRRYLLGIFFVLVIVSVGVDSLLIPLVLQRRFLNLVIPGPEIASRKVRPQSCQTRGQVVMKRFSRPFVTNRRCNTRGVAEEVLPETRIDAVPSREPGHFQRGGVGCGLRGSVCHAEFAGAGPLGRRRVSQVVL